MPDTVCFTDDTELAVAAGDADEVAVDGVHLADLSFVLDLETRDGEVTYCEVDLRELVRVMTLYASMEEHRYDWR